MLTPGQFRFFTGVGVFIAAVTILVLGVTVIDARAQVKVTGHQDCVACHAAQAADHPAAKE